MSKKKKVAEKEGELPDDLKREILGILGDDDLAVPVDFENRVNGKKSRVLGNPSVVTRDMSYDGKNLKIDGVSVVGTDPGDRVIPGGLEGERKLVPVYDEVRVLVADIADPVQRKNYEEALKLIATSMGTWIPFEMEKEPNIFPDPTSPVGYRAIVILKYAKVTKVTMVSSPVYEEVSEKLMKKKFFPNHVPLDLETDEDIGNLDDNSTADKNNFDNDEQKSSHI